MRLLGLLIVVASLTAAAAPPAGFFDALRNADARVAAIGYRLTTGNVALCRERQPQLGWALHALDQYGPDTRDAARRAFGFETLVAVEAVVPGGPAAMAGVARDDGLVTVDRIRGEAVPSPSATTEHRRRIEDQLAALPESLPVTLVLRRAGADRRAVVAPVPGCRAAFEMILSNEWDADSDGRLVRISSRFLERFGDEAVAGVLAHELAHVILRHRARLDAAKVDRGLLRELGRNGRLFRQTEDEADALSVALLANAGYDPVSAARFWAGEGSRLDGGLFRARTHRSARARAERLAAAAAALAGQSRPVSPPILAMRDEPLR